jgi:hypothetical protein
MASTLAVFETSGFLLRVRTCKNLCVRSSFDNEEALHHRNVDASKTIRNFPGIFERMRRSVMRSVDAWSESHGQYFEHLL